MGNIKIKICRMAQNMSQFVYDNGKIFIKIV
jgi:hypothetical protein